MSELPQSQTPLVGIDMARDMSSAGDDAGVVLAERSDCRHYNVRGDANDSDFRKALKTVLQNDLPAPNHCTVAAEHTLLGLGPDEWLWMSGAENADAAVTVLDAELAGLFATLPDLSSAQTVLEVQGTNAADVLAKGTPFDLHPREFPPGTCTQTVLAKAVVVIQRISNDTFRVIVRRSFADYLWRWLEDAALEYGFRIASVGQSRSGDGTI